MLDILLQDINNTIIISNQCQCLATRDDNKIFKTLCMSLPEIGMLVHKVSLQFGFWLPKILKAALIVDDLCLQAYQFHFYHLLSTVSPAGLEVPPTWAQVG